MVEQKINRNTIIFLIILITIMFSILFIPVHSFAIMEHHALKGELDLTKMSVLDEPIKLRGEWEFYWKQFLEYEDESINSAYYVMIPNEWRNHLQNDHSFSKYGYGTYRLTIHLNEQDLDQTIALYIPSIASAYKMTVNGQLLTKVGKVGKNRWEMVPGNKPHVVTFKPDSKHLQFDIQVSNYHQRKSGLWSTIIFGKSDDVTEIREKKVVFQMFVIGCIFIIGFYHLILYSQRSKEKSPLYLAIGCFCIVIRTLLLKDNLFIYILPEMNWEMTVRIEYIVALLALLSFYLFFNEEIPFKFSINLAKWIVYMIATYILFILLTPPYIFTNTFLLIQLISFGMMLYILVASYIGIRKRMEGAVLTFLAIIILCVAVINDLFHYSNHIFTDEFISVGFLFYLFIQSIHLARKAAHSYEDIERLSSELQQLNLTLENKVEKRTNKIREVNRKLKRTELARKRLFSVVSHELSTPLTSIQGYIKAMLDEIVPRNNSVYLRMIYSESQLMAHLIKDLNDLSKLETGQVVFNFQLTEIKSFLFHLYDEQKYVVETANISFIYEDHTQGDFDIFCMIDHVRIKQVILNLVVNAKKFTPRGGSITIKISNSLKNELIKISVIDTGIGITDIDLPHVFERFYKVNDQHDSEEGKGLGLAIVKEIVEYHKGTVSVKSTLNVGSEFSFTLPIEKLDERGATEQ